MSLPLRELVDHPELVNERAQALDWDELLYDYERALDDDLALLAGLSEAQIHFKPTPEEFSICEVLTHDADSDRLFWMWVKLLIEDRRDEINPADLISGDGANNVIGLEALRGEIEACRALARTLIDARPDTPALTPTSPHPYFGELNGKGWIYFMALHHGIHLRQCARVIAARGFPPAESVQHPAADEYLQPRNRKTWLAPNDKAKERTGAKAIAHKRDKAKKRPAAKAQGRTSARVKKQKPVGQKRPSGKKAAARR